MRSWFLCCWMWAALCGDSSACGNTGMGGIWQANIPSFVLLTHPLPVHHLQSRAAVTSWVFPREGWDKHETCPQPYQRVGKESQTPFFESGAGGSCSPGQSSGWALPLGLGTDLTSRKLQFPAWKQILYPFISCGLISSSWLVLHEGVDGHTSSF